MTGFAFTFADNRKSQVEKVEFFYLLSVFKGFAPNTRRPSRAVQKKDTILSYGQEEFKL